LSYTYLWSNPYYSHTIIYPHIHPEIFPIFSLDNIIQYPAFNILLQNTHLASFSSNHRWTCMNMYLISNGFKCEKRTTLLTIQSPGMRGPLFDERTKKSLFYCYIYWAGILGNRLTIHNESLTYALHILKWSRTSTFKKMEPLGLVII
jgi:hypothetical protein